MVLKKVLHENKLKLLTESKRYILTPDKPISFAKYIVLIALFKHNNVEYKKEIAETFLDSKTSKKNYI